jgi:hypothetical protein
MAFGQAPGDLSSMFAQRLCWAMGTVQVYCILLVTTAARASELRSSCFVNQAAQHVQAPSVSTNRADMKSNCPTGPQTWASHMHPMYRTVCMRTIASKLLC